MKVLFVNSKNVKKQVAKVATRKQAFEEIVKYCKEEKNYEVRLTRSWKKDNVIVVDYGSHTEFFHIVLDENEMNMKSIYVVVKYSGDPENPHKEPIKVFAKESDAVKFIDENYKEWLGYDVVDYEEGTEE